MSALSPKYDDPLDRSDNHTFLQAQTARLLGSFPDRTLRVTPAHRTGLWRLLQTVYAECFAAQVPIRVILPPAYMHRFDRIARYYTRALQPPSFRAFSAVTTRTAGIPPQTLVRYRKLYRSILPAVREAIKMADTTSLSAKEIADAMAEDLIKRLSEQPLRLGRDWWKRHVQPDLFLRKKTFSKPYQAARLLAARLAGLDDRSQVQLERYLKAPSHAPWRIPEWETPEATALAEQIHLPHS